MSDIPNPLPGWHIEPSVPPRRPTDHELVLASYETDEFDQGLFDLLLRMVGDVWACRGGGVMGADLAGDWYERITGYLRLTADPQAAPDGT